MKRLSHEKRKEILERYLAGGRNAVAADCASLGVCASYAASLAYEAGLTRRPRKAGLEARDAKDHRWARAKAVGAISR
ncbi:hypothetical protein QIH87_50160 (plasmid) [Bradyrhizobium elkanii]|jgi:hypothetical protein|uniref:hypothetical protein n=1 Tax=Bradyrhizobium elkanii TaxID=29448 RepID=UPI0027155612|nr:hypothetical protein [Bradyrhizobium elkanii]WLA80344.1 hypothetical protein QNJ99_33910 [Bradyrhizobium elkanii]WLB14797.1 hypothetical protein QIH87_50160 [Bradyrhizobium elkanii]WLB69112.1 hypothetical protein QIH89_27760 [Bradyrhizobium elkanii]